LFGPGEEHNIYIDVSLWDALEKISDDDNTALTRPFNEIEIKEALFSMEKNKAAGPDKIPIEFYQSCWDIVKGDIMQLFADFLKRK